MTFRRAHEKDGTRISRFVGACRHVRLPKSYGFGEHLRLRWEQLSEDGTQYVLVDSNDVLIGDVLGGTSVVTSTGHYVGYIASNGEVGGQVYYSGTDGSGTAYCWGSLLSNQVVRDAVSGVLYQPATGEVIYSVETQSRAFDNDDSYSNVNWTMSYAMELTPLGTENALIGLPSSIAMPLRIEKK